MIAQTAPLIATPSIAWSSLLPQLILMVGGVIGLTVVSLATVA